MKKLRASINGWLNKLGGRWQELPLQQQHRFIGYFFLFYLVLTIGVLMKVWYDAGKPGHRLVIEHIEPPLIQRNESSKSWQDSLSTILKNNFYERK